ncbi:hypothetical protein TRFO_23212 [Tritrichomonas foetus]|uniref:E2F/DP family winged-helix DNA-binding domain-containing protein n=1 Tax=Tritrichomonas foetus TaxID=1144522 RepID=A0A1J4KAA6_9EUKA|nr:hypothetical protein TRFO_23212 [Tritrichomonas foetus]|eukprot:OHT08369.1 hypothetical protein TRFO_23212 [Tritrichomonas foetus]
MQVSSPSSSEVSSPCEPFVIQLPNTSRSYHQYHEEKESNEKESRKYTDQFKTSIQSFIHNVEESGSKIVSVNKSCSKFGFQRRRFYDVLNVLEAIGVCNKLNAESVQWLGLSNIPSTLLMIQKTWRVDNTKSTLEDIFQTEQSIVISHLTRSFLMCYLVMQCQALDIKQVATFLSRSNQRYKTTLCKLYQIAHILEASGILHRTMVPCVMMLEQQYFAVLECRSNYEYDSNPLALTNLLNDHKSREFKEAVERRRVEFFVCYKRIETRPYHFRSRVPTAVLA